jgi:DNA-binding transcriptional LysR family regulator
VTMDEAFGGLPDVTWLRRTFPKAEIAARSNNRDAQARLCAEGAGIAVLPKPLAKAYPTLQELRVPEPPPGRDTHVGYHRDLKRLTRLRKLLDLVIEKLAG